MNSLKAKSIKYQWIKKKLTKYPKIISPTHEQRKIYRMKVILKFITSSTRENITTTGFQKLVSRPGAGGRASNY